MTVTNGVLEFEQRVVDGDFRHRLARASISFSGEDYDTARRTAVDQVSKALGLKSDSQIIVPAPVQLVATTSSMEQRHAVEGLDINGVLIDSPHEMPATDLIGPSTLPKPAGKRGRKSAVDPTPLSDGDTPQAPTDGMLQAACQARMEQGMVEQDPQISSKIRQLIAQFTGELGKKASDIPQDRRMAFLADLKAIATTSIANGLPQ